MTLYGYARVSTKGQKLGVQLDALRDAGCERVFTDKLSGAKRARPGLTELLGVIGEGDTLVVHRLDRLARSTIDLLNIAVRLNEVGADLRSLSDPWADTTTPQGRLILSIMGSLAEFERELILQRSAEGRKRALADGKVMGRPPRMKPSQVAIAREHKDDGKSYRAIEDIMGIPKSVIERELKRVS